MTSADQIATSAAIIAFFAFVTSIWQAYISRKHNILSIKPAVEILVDTRGEVAFTISLTNHGLGPARIKSIHGTVSNITYELTKSGVAEFLVSQLKVEGVINVTVKSFDVDDHTYIAPSKEIELIKIQADDPTKQQQIANSAINALKNIKLIIDYECIYNKIYATTFDGKNVLAKS